MEVAIFIFVVFYLVAYIIFAIKETTVALRKQSKIACKTCVHVYRGSSPQECLSNIEDNCNQANCPHVQRTASINVGVLLTAPSRAEKKRQEKERRKNAAILRAQVKTKHVQVETKKEPPEQQFYIEFDEPITTHKYPKMRKR